MPSQDDLAVEVLLDEESFLPEGLSIPELESLAGHVLREEGMTGSWEIGIQLMDDDAMQRAHREFMDIDSPTDIMTFPYEDEPFGGVPGGEHMPLGGDLMISVDRAADHAADAGWSTVEELRFLLVHGILHILGWDDMSDDDRDAMLGRQSELLNSWEH